MFTIQAGLGLNNQANNLGELTSQELVSILGDCSARLAHRGPMNLEWPIDNSEIPPDFNFGDYVGQGEPSYNDFVIFDGLNINSFGQNAPLVVSNPASEPGPDPQGGQYFNVNGGFAMYVNGVVYITDLVVNNLWYSGTQGGIYGGTPNMCWGEVEVPTNLSYDPVACTMSWETRTIRVMVPCKSTGGAGTDVTQGQGTDNTSGTDRSGGSIYPILGLPSVAAAVGGYFYYN